jgi:hypothetical protein
MFTGKWTDEDTINALMQSSAVPSPSEFDEPVLITASAPTQLRYSGVDAGLILKQQRTLTPTILGPTLAGIVPQPVTAGERPIRGTVQCFIGGVEYIENYDFVVDYVAGTIRRTTPGSNIPSGSVVSTSCLEWTTLAEGVDYSVNYAAGQITRLAGSSIASGVYVSVDYSHAAILISSLAIREMIQQAEALMLQSIADPTLQNDLTRASASLLTMSLICLSQATKVLMIPESTAANRSKELIALASAYGTRADSTFLPLRKAMTSTSWGGIIQNRFAGSRENTLVSPSLTPGYRRR